MKQSQLTSGELVRAQKTFLLFNLFNVVSFNFLSGNIITLYALRLGAGSFLIGTLASFVPLAQLLPLAGRLLVPHLGAAKLMGIFWFVRYLLVVPVLFAPIYSAVGNPSGALVLCIVGVLGFNIARGIAMTGYNPVFGAITTERDRGSFLAKNQIVVHSVSIFTGITIALLLGRESPLYMYTIIIGFGVVSGVVASWFVFKLPEPPETRKALTLGLIANLAAALKKPAFRKFITVLFVTFFTVYMIQPFLIVFMKAIYNQGDNNVVYFTVIGSIGAITVALLIGFMVDRIGAKPLYFVFAGIIAIPLIPLIASPPLDGIAFWVYAGGIFFLFMTGLSGLSNAANTYFFALINEEEHLNLGIVYFITTGVSGTLGSLLGGAVLEWLHGIGRMSNHEVFRAYFGLIAIACIAVLFLAANLERLGGYRIRDAFTFFLSPRDLRAMSLLHRLDRSRSLEEEKSVIQALGESKSDITTTELLQRMRSPRFTLRAEALRGLYNVSPDENMTRILVSEVKNHTYTTAYMAAELLGIHRIHEGTKALRQALRSRDYFLGGKSMVALARLGDQESLPAIKAVLEQTNNPRLIIHAATACEIYRDLSAISILVKRLKRKTSPYVRDEIILSIGGILGMDAFFYPLYTRFLDGSTQGISELRDVIQSRQNGDGPPIVGHERLLATLTSLARDKRVFMAEIRQILEEGDLIMGSREATDSFLLTTHDTQYVRLDRFCYLLAAATVWFAHRPMRD